MRCVFKVSVWLCLPLILLRVYTTSLLVPPLVHNKVKFIFELFQALVLSLSAGVHIPLFDLSRG